MYFVDREKMIETLDYMNGLLTLAERISSDDELEMLALERIAQNLIESIIDVGNGMIDGFIMRDPGGYEDVIDILSDESVLPNDEAEAIKEIVRLRKMLVRDYLHVDHDLLKRTIASHREALKQFPLRVMDYLNQELGPISAFSPDKGEKG
jgi:uncharacterized protein YutE (UPF0331/DUF86 family)